jgi:hypothetical protein
MKKIITITGFFAILGIATVGCLYIFDVMNFEDSRSLLLKSEAAIVLLGGCTALISLLTGKKEQPPD